METMDLALRTAFVPEELEALFKFIPSSQLLKFRQVSQECHEAAETVLRKGRDIKLFLTTDNSDGRFNWEFLQFLNDSPENVFVAPVIHIKNANESDQDLEEGKICIAFQIIQEIIERLGNRGIIRELIIEDGIPAPHFTSDFIFALLSHLSTLETLKFTKLGDLQTTSEQSPKFQLLCLKQLAFGFGIDFDMKEVRNLLRIILESSPKLENTSSSSQHGYQIPKLRDLELISLLRDTKHLSKMKEIILTKSAELDILLQCQPKIQLHSLRIETKKDAVDSKKLFTFLQQQADNLKSFRCDGIAKSIVTLPVLPVLEKLTFEPWDSDCLLSVNYGIQTPALKSLTITSAKASFQSWEEFLFYEVSSEIPPCLSLEEMKLNIDDGVLQTVRTYQKVFDNWKNLFPNVKKLTLRNVSQFEVDQFSKCWPKLETLELQFLCRGKDLDDLLFGISPDWKKEIDTTEENWWMKIPTPEIKGTVANLKCLKELNVEVINFWGAVTLTDSAVYFGLRHMQNLRKLKIGIISQDSAQVGGFSKEAFDFLVENLPKLEKLSVLRQEWERGDNL